jgi:hypothetical protein
VRTPAVNFFSPLFVTVGPDRQLTLVGKRAVNPCRVIIDLVDSIFFCS